MGPDNALEKLLSRWEALPPDQRAVFWDMIWKAARGDWHGVSDAANDLRVLEARYP